MVLYRPRPPQVFTQGYLAFGASKTCKPLEASLQKCLPGLQNHANRLRHPYKSALQDFKSAGTLRSNEPGQGILLFTEGGRCAPPQLNRLSLLARCFRFSSCSRAARAARGSGASRPPGRGGASRPPSPLLGFSFSSSSTHHSSIIHPSSIHHPSTHHPSITHPSSITKLHSFSITYHPKSQNFIK